MRRRRFTHSLVAVLVLVSLLLQGTLVLAGTTGTLSGTVLDAKSQPVASAKVTATSPSQTVTATTDGGGHFTFASLAPDTYTVSVDKQGFEPTSQAGVSVFADQQQTINLATRVSLKEIGRVTSRAVTDLVKPGTTADVYSVNALQQSKFSGLGGGGGLNNAYSAIASVPGAYVPTNQAGYFQTIHIRGGDYDQVGYEVDGVPVNRSFDNYPSGTASSLGQQELQVYTGAAPANAEGQGLSGFINQVIRAGTYPGFANADIGVGGPAFYHKANFEVGGATPNRNFSYYLGVGGYNQDLRYIDQGNGQSVAQNFGSIGAPLGGNLSAAELATFCADPVRANSYFSCYANGTTAPGGYSTTSSEFGSASTINDRDTVVNLHFGLPHHGDGSKDDIQLLYLNNFLRTQFFTGGGDLTNVATQSPTQVLSYVDSFAFNAPTGTALPANYQSLTGPYYFPSSPGARATGSAIALNNRDSYQNNQSIFKVQYQKNFSSNAYFRLYGYTDYSNWLINGPNYAAYSGLASIGGVSRDYELSSHTQGLSATFADQINAKNLVQLQGSFTTSATLRDNNRQINDAAGYRARFATVVDSSNPTNGICYKVAAGSTVGTPAFCSPQASAANRATYATLSQASAGTIPFAATIGTRTCGGGPCEYFVVENGQNATYNSVRPRFYGLSLTDTFKPTDKLLLNLGVRYDSFGFQGSDTTGTSARTLFFNAFNRDNCTDGKNAIFAKPSLMNAATGAPLTIADACTLAGAGFAAPGLSNVSAQQQQYPVFQPRLGATYTLNPDTVLRVSYGRYAQAPNTAFEQYNYLQQDSPAQLGTSFYKYGFRSPSHAIKPEVSNNYDFSLEHHFKGTDLSFKLTPFYRYTQNQIQTFFLDQPSGFVSGLNADRLTARGFELQMNKGDFGRDGFAGQLSFTYTNAYAQYNKFAGGSSVFDGINADIQNYNGYTKACAVAGNNGCPGAAASPNAVPCFAQDGTPAPGCAAGSIANPYFNAPIQGLVDTNGKYQPFSLVTGPIGASANSYLVPYVATLIANYKKDKFAITPSLQFTGGQRYGVPETSAGIDPALGCSPLAGSTVGDPRYQYGAAGGAPYDAASCAGVLNAIPNPFTKRFDGIADFVNPSQLVANMQLSYEASKNITFVATFANILNNCFGGSKQAWTTGGSNVCSYGLVSAGNAQPFYGNVYNPTSVVDPVISSPYQRSYGAFNTDGSSLKNPFSVYVDAKIKL